MVSSESFLTQVAILKEIDPMGVSLQPILIPYLVLNQQLPGSTLKTARLVSWTPVPIQFFLSQKIVFFIKSIAKN